MLPTTISTTDPRTGVEFAVPADFHHRVERATLLVEEDLGDAVEGFGLTAGWQFVRGPEGALAVRLTLSAEPGRAAAVTSADLTAEQLRDDRSARNALYPVLLRLTHRLSELIKTRLNEVRELLYQNVYDLNAHDLVTTIGE